MSGHALTRRSFLVGSAGVAAVAAGAGLVSLSVRGEADADAETDKRTEVVHSLCNSCSSKCGYYAYVVDGELTKLIGDEAHPNAQGKLCARGYGYSQIAYSPDRLTDPMKKNENGEFEVIGWDQALSEIGQKVNDIIAQYGPEALAMVQDPRPSGKYYTKRFMNALGSPNVYTHGAACNLSKESGFTQAIGAANFESDVANSKMTMFIGRSYADAIRPSSVAALQQAHENGAHIVLVDPRLNNSIAFADEWVPINPGTDLALILAMSNVLINRDLYDAEYVAANSAGVRCSSDRVHAGMGRGHHGHSRRHHRAAGARVRRGGPRGLHRAELARRLRMLVRELGRDGARAVPIQHASGLLEPARRGAVPPQREGGRP